MTGLVIKEGDLLLAGFTGGNVLVSTTTTTGAIVECSGTLAIGKIRLILSIFLAFPRLLPLSCTAGVGTFSMWCTLGSTAGMSTFSDGRRFSGARGNGWTGRLSSFSVEKRNLSQPINSSLTLKLLTLRRTAIHNDRIVSFPVVFATRIDVAVGIVDR